MGLTVSYSLSATSCQRIVGFLRFSQGNTGYFMSSCWPWLLELGREGSSLQLKGYWTLQWLQSEIIFVFWLVYTFGLQGCVRVSSFMLVYGTSAIKYTDIFYVIWRVKDALVVDCEDSCSGSRVESVILGLFFCRKVHHCRCLHNKRHWLMHRIEYQLVSFKNYIR